MWPFSLRLLPWPLSSHETLDFITQIATHKHIYSMSFCTYFPFTHSEGLVQIKKAKILCENVVYS